MSPVKQQCTYCPPDRHRPPSGEDRRQWELHPSFLAGLDSLHAYSHWVDSVVLPIAFQWIEEHKPEVYASVPEDLRDDVGVVLAAAFRLVKKAATYEKELEHRAIYDAELADGTLDTSKINPVWTAITRKIRACTKEAHDRHAETLGEDKE